MICMGIVSDYDSNVEEIAFIYGEIIQPNKQQIEVKNVDENCANIILNTFSRHSSYKMKPMTTVGGEITVEKDKEGNSEVTVEGHASTKSDDGNTEVSTSGEVTIDTKGNVSYEVKASIEFEF